MVNRSQNNTYRIPLLITGRNNYDSTMKKRRYPLAEATFKARFQGPAVEDGTMGARDFANALIGLADTITLASDTLGIPAEQTPIVKIKDIREGSFLYEVLLVSDLTGVQIIWESLKGDDATALANLGAIITIVGGSVELTRRIGGRAIRSIKKVKNSEDVELELEDGTIELAKESEAKLVQNPHFQTAARKATKPLSREGVESLQLETGTDDKPEIMERIEKADLPAFEPRRDDLQSVINEFPITVRFKSVKFDGDGKWSITDDEHSYSVEILDEDFLARIDNGLAIQKNDYFRILLRHEQIPNGEKFKNKYSIVKVVEDLPASRINTALPIDME